MDTTKPPPSYLRLVHNSDDLESNEIPPHEDMSPVARLRPPRGTPRRVRAIWNEQIPFIQSGMLIEAEAFTFLQWCYAQFLFELAWKDFAASGHVLVIKDADGVEVAAPLYGILSARMDALLPLDTALGFTPAARARMARDAQQPEDHWE